MKHLIQLALLICLSLMMASRIVGQPVSVRAMTPEQWGDEAMTAGKYDAAIGSFTQQWVSWAAGFAEDEKTQPNRERLAGKMAAALAKMESPPAAPENAEFHATKGATFIKEAKTPAHFVMAVKEFQDAVNQAPWVYNYHFNLAVAYKSARQFKPALNSIAIAKILAANDKDRRDANALRAEIEAAQEMDASAKAQSEKQAAADSPQAREAALLAKVEGSRFISRNDLGGMGGYDEILEIKGGMLLISIKIYAPPPPGGTFYGKNQTGTFTFEPIPFLDGAFKNTSDQRRIFTIRADGQAIMRRFPDTPEITIFPIPIEK